MYMNGVCLSGTGESTQSGLWDQLMDINVVIISEEEQLIFVSKTIKLCSAYKEFCNRISEKW